MDDYASIQIETVLHSVGRLLIQNIYNKCNLLEINTE